MALLIEVKRHRILHCKQCGLGETERGSNEASYDAAYLEQQWTGANPSQKQVERAVRAELRRVRVIERSAAGRRLLELGVGHGYFLEAARRRGFEVCGMDVSRAAAQFAHSRFGLEVAVAAIEDANLPGAAFDVVAAWHVLEHVADPRAALRKAREWLAPGGIIAVEVPNYESYDARVQGAHWQGWQPQYHRWHFTPRALARLLEEAGFAVEQMWSPPSRIARERLKRIPFVGLFRPILSRFYSGTGVAAIARK
jgi:2-polyprenyl-3-methyl-5-hydroxy-6-metoxy-1,4-benzoquinol methylase